MILKQLLSIVFFFQITLSFGCLDAYQFKMFPIGVYKNQIVTVDVVINRGTYFGSEDEATDNRDIVGLEVMWFLQTYISTYSKKHELLSKIPLDTISVIGESYEEALNKVFLKGLNQVQKELKGIDYFIPESISFCDYQKTCQQIKMESDTVVNSTQLVIQGKSYSLDFIKGESSYSYNDIICEKHPLHLLYINSVRMYKTKNISIVVSHLGTGSQIYSRNRATNSSEKNSVKDPNTYIPKEYIPDFKFTTLQSTTYQEPVLHHGFGIDVFVVL